MVATEEVKKKKSSANWDVKRRNIRVKRTPWLRNDFQRSSSPGDLDDWIEDLRCGQRSDRRKKCESRARGGNLPANFLPWDYSPKGLHRLSGWMTLQRFAN